MKFFRLAFLGFIVISAFQTVYAQNSRGEKIPRMPICNGIAENLPPPEIPQAAIEANAKGVVNVQILIDEQGNVASASAVSGHPLLRPAAEKAARRAKFKITRYSGKPIKVPCAVVYNFKNDSLDSTPRVREESKSRSIEKVVSCGVCNQKAVSLPKPEYPKAASAANISGAVSVLILIDEKGNVTEAKAVSGHPLLQSSAVKAALQAKFEPLLLSGKPVKMRGIIVYNYSTDSVTESRQEDFIVSAINLPRPPFPSNCNAKFKKDEVVVVEAEIDESGNVTSASGISGHPCLKAGAIQAARFSKFEKPMFSGTPVKAKAQIIYTFILDSKIEQSVFVNWVKPINVSGADIYNFDSFAKIIKVGIVNKKALKLPKPTFNANPPKQLLIMAVQIIIDESGNVIAAKSVSGYPLIRHAVENSAKQAKFSPTLINGPPIKVEALLVYKFKPDGTIDTDIEKDDKDVIGTPINLVEPPPPFCNCRFGAQNPSVLLEAKTDERGNVTEAKAFSGHAILRPAVEKAALESNFLPANIKAKILIQYNFEATDESARQVKFKNIEVKEVKIEK